MKFQYQARTSDGEVQSGVIEASSEEGALQVLEQGDLYLTALVPESEEPIYSKKITLFGGGASMKDVLLFSRQLAIMFKSQVPLVESLETIAGQLENEDFRQRIFHMAEEVEAGTALSEALEKHPNTFSSFYVNMVNRGETIGNLAEVLEYLADHIERDYELRNKVKGALIYPVAVIIVAIVVIVLLMAFVIPNIARILTESGQELPIITKIVIWISEVMSAWWWAIFGAGGVLGGALFWGAKKTARGKDIVDRGSLRIPVLNSLLRTVFVTRFGENLATLISGGVPIVRSLEITKNIVGNNVYQDIADEAKREVEGGATISSVLKRYPDHFPAVFTQMVSVGEKSGRIEETLMEIVQFYQKEVDRKIENFLTLLQPALILVLGGIVGAIISAVLLPMYQMTTAVQ